MKGGLSLAMELHEFDGAPWLLGCVAVTAGGCDRSYVLVFTRICAVTASLTKRTCPCRMAGSVE